MSNQNKEKRDTSIVKVLAHISLGKSLKVAIAAIIIVLFIQAGIAAIPPNTVAETRATQSWDKNRTGLVNVTIIRAKNATTDETVNHEFKPVVSRYIITFKEGVDKATMQEIVSNAGGKFIRELWIINGAAILLPEKAEKALKKAKGVISLREDEKVYAIGETLPWGVDRIDADLVWDRNGDLVCDEGANTGSGIKTGILDTGGGLQSSRLG